MAGERYGVGRRHELTDAAWAVLEPLLPPQRHGGRGRPARDVRQVVNGILWILATGCPWRDLPERYGPWQTCYHRFNAWAKDGTWERLYQALLARMAHRRANRLGALVRGWDEYSRAARGSGGAEKGGPAAEPADHALGRSRGGWGTKLHLACDGRGTITAFCLTAGQTHECTQLATLLEPVRLGRRRRPQCLLGDRGYSTRAIRVWAQYHHVRLVVPERVDQLAQRAHRPGRKPVFDWRTYRRRNIIERAVGWLKHWRRIATRAEKLALCFHAAICLVLAASYAAKYFSDTT